MERLQAIFLVLVLVACLSTSGCVQPTGSSPLTPAVTLAGIDAPGPETPVAAAAATDAPQKVVTVIRYISQTRDLKDTTLLFTLQVPAEWNVSTRRMMRSDTSDYRTDLVSDDVFAIYSYPASRSREQEYRDRFRQWNPAPAVNAVTINDIRFERFESSAGGNTTVAYLAGTNSVNERGYASVLVFSARDSNRFEREDFEKVVSSFRYFSVGSAGTVPGEEIPLYDMSGNSLPRNADDRSLMMFNSSDWDTAGSSGEESSGGSSSGGSSSGGCGCGG